MASAKAPTIVSFSAHFAWKNIHSTMIIPMVYLKRTNRWFQRVNRNHLREFQEDLRIFQKKKNDSS